MSGLGSGASASGSSTPALASGAKNFTISITGASINPTTKLLGITGGNITDGSGSPQPIITDANGKLIISKIVSTSTTSISFKQGDVIVIPKDTEYTEVVSPALASLTAPLFALPKTDTVLYGIIMEDYPPALVSTTAPPALVSTTAPPAPSASAAPAIANTIKIKLINIIASGSSSSSLSAATKVAPIDVTGDPTFFFKDITIAGSLGLKLVKSKLSEVELLQYLFLKLTPVDVASLVDDAKINAAVNLIDTQIDKLFAKKATVNIKSAGDAQLTPGFTGFDLAKKQTVLNEKITNGDKDGVYQPIPKDLKITGGSKRPRTARRRYRHRYSRRFRRY